MGSKTIFVKTKSFIGAALIGTTFSWWDFPHYAIGCYLGWLWIRWLNERKNWVDMDSNGITKGLYSHKKIEIDPVGLHKAVLPIGQPFSRIWHHQGIWRPVGC